MARRITHWSAHWGILGILALLLDGIIRLLPRALVLCDVELAPVHWVGLILCVVFMAISEGYLGFHLAFSPRAAARAVVVHQRRPWVKYLAPLFCMALFDATPRRTLLSWWVLSMIIGLIVAIGYLPSPWRGIVDAGVVVGLSWGFVSTSYFYLVAIRHGTTADAELP